MAGMADFVSRIGRKPSCICTWKARWSRRRCTSSTPELPRRMCARCTDSRISTGFLEAFGAVVKRLRTPEDYALVTRRLLERLAGAERALRRDHPVGRRGAVEGAGVRADLRRRARGGGGFAGGGAVDSGRGAAVRRRTCACRWRSWRRSAWTAGVVAFGIGGNEERGPAGWFAEVFALRARGGAAADGARRARAGGPESVWAALRTGGGAHRARHRGRSDDPVLVQHLRDRDIPLEISITSNLVTGVVARLEDAPGAAAVRRRRADHAEHRRPGDVRTTLTREYELAARSFGFTEESCGGSRRTGSGTPSTCPRGSPPR